MANQSLAFDFISNPSHPYYLHPSENPSQVLVSSLLDGRNYHAWSHAISMALLSKNKTGFIDGTLPQPPNMGPSYNAWQRCNTTVLSWLHRSISSSILPSILWIDKAEDAWKDLKERFSQADIFRISNLQEEIYMLKQGDKNVSEYFTHLKGLCDELENLRPLPTCQCAMACNCPALLEIRVRRDQDHTIRFLKGLNEQYAPVRSQIMLITPLPDVNKVCSMLAQQEREFYSSFPVNNAPKAFISESDESRSYYSSGRGRGSFNSRGGRGRGRDSRFCTHCKMSNHTIETCYFKHGFPPGYRMRNDQTDNGAARANCAERNLESSAVTLSTQQFHDLVQAFQLSPDLPHSNPVSTPTSHANLISTSALSAESSKSSPAEYQEEDWYS